MVLSKGKLGIIGTGVMGQTLARGILKAKLLPATKIWGSAKTAESVAKAKKDLGIATAVNYNPLLAGTEMVLVCVKPAGIRSVLKQLKENGLPPDAVVVSIVAGTTIEDIEETLGTKNPVIRAMPNTPCVVGQGMTVITAGTHAKSQHLKTAQQIFESVGVVMQLEEQHFDAVTALGGSGPAYMYLIMESLADGGVRVGLPRQAALQIVAQTVLGAATMVRQSGRHPASLRDDVTTPAGCTIGALLTMEDGKIRSVLARAVEEATRIASRLGKKSGEVSELDKQYDRRLAED